MKKQNSPGEIRLSQKQILGIAGCLITFVGVFMPIVSVPVVGDMNYFRNGEGDGVLVLILSAISLVLVLTKFFQWLWITGGVSLAVICLTLINFRQKFSEAKYKLAREMEGNIFAGIGEVMIDSVQFKWGWAVMLIDACLHVRLRTAWRPVGKTMSRLIVFFMIVLFGISTTEALAQHKEDYYNKLLAKRLGGKLEVVYHFNYTANETSRIRIDIETDDYVIEGGRDKRSSLDSVQQAVLASILSGKKPAVAIYDTDGKWGKYEHRIWMVAKELGIRYIWFSNGEIVEK